LDPAYQHFFQISLNLKKKDFFLPFHALFRDWDVLIKFLYWFPVEICFGKISPRDVKKDENFPEL